METKTCTKCKEAKPLNQFYKDYVGRGTDGLDYYCKYCRMGSSIQSRRNQDKKCVVDPCGRPHYAKGWCRNHYERMKRRGQLESCYDVVEDEKVYLYAKKRITYKRAYNLMYKYKLEMERYNEMISQGCHVCGEYQERNLHVDHDHSCCSGQVTCGKCVRGVLCNKCNTSVAKYEDGSIRADHPQINNIRRYLNG